MTSHRNKVVLLSRYPTPGTTKTRLIPILGPWGAAALQQAMTRRIANQIEALGKMQPLAAEICYSGGDLDRSRQWLGSAFNYRPQGDGDLGRRMARVVKRADKENVRRLIMVGADIPQLNQAVLRHAFELLDQHPLVLGPTKDGGYYLMGLDVSTEFEKLMPLFEGIPWGNDRVLAQTVAAADKAGLTSAFTKVLQDVDRADDIAVWRNIWKNRPLTSASISVIIPTFNEERHIGRTIAAAQTVDDVEIIAVDGGSGDRTVIIAEALGAITLACPPSKARQMNLAAEKAAGRILCFLHADTTLPDNYPRLIRQTLARSGVSAGAFSFCTNVDSAAFKRVAAGANWRSRTFQLPYGDQALFMTKTFFEQVGGYPEIPIMEDVALVLRLQKKGRVVTLPDVVATSARRWRHLGAVKTTLMNQAILAAYFAKVPPTQLARWYQRSRYR